MDRGLKLNAGCGDDYREGSWVNLDIDPALTPDVAHDLNELPWPFGPGTFDSVLMSHVVEHLYSPYRVLNEASRVTREEGIVVVKTPFRLHRNMLRDSDHKNVVVKQSFQLVENLELEKVSVNYRFPGKASLYDKAMHLLKFHRFVPEETVYRCRVVKSG